MISRFYEEKCLCYGNKILKLKILKCLLIIDGSNNTLFFNCNKVNLYYNHYNNYEFSLII